MLMLRQFRESAIWRALLALILCAYCLPGTTILCLDSQGGRSLGHSCHCEDCRPYQGLQGDECQLDCCAAAKAGRMASQLASDAPADPAAPENHSSNCCTHHELHAAPSHAHAGVHLPALAMLYCLPAERPAVALPSEDLSQAYSARGSPQTYASKTLQAISSIRLLI